ncbi:MAG: phosphoenolpyruvate kinase, partial [Acidobacteria bacterium]|nr:phosphoenolpyruvate kinase [Acidobacteriota bacterium]
MSHTILKEGDEGVRLVIKDVEPTRTHQNQTRSPVHVVYGGAHLYKSGVERKLGAIALDAVKKYAGTVEDFALVFGFSRSNDEHPSTKTNFATEVYSKTIAKLEREPVEDYRIDFEDGYGFREDAEEDADAISAATELATSFEERTLSPFCGIRIKAPSHETYGRSVRTLHVFLENFLAQSNGALPPNFAVTLPKVTHRREVKDLVKHLSAIEKKNDLSRGAIAVEIMVETPESLIDGKGRFALPAIVKAANGRCVAVHFGAYDYTSLLGISADHQRIDHPACDFARQIMLSTLSPLGIRLSDSVTTELPVEMFRGKSLTKKQVAANADT